MKSKTFVFFGACAALTSCSAEPEVSQDDHSAMGHEGHHMVEVSEREERDKEEAASLFIARFEVEQCGGVDMLGRVRKTEADGTQTILRAFAASNDCADEVKAVVEGLDFSETEPGVYASTESDEGRDRVFIQREEDGSGAVVEWESVGK